MKGPKHAHVQRNARQEHPPCVRVLFDFLHENRVHVFQAVALVDDHLTPVILGEMNSVFDDHLVSGDDNGKGRQLNGRIRVIVILSICLVGTILIF